MRLVGATLYALRIPFVESFSHSATERRSSDSVVVRVRDEARTEGFAEGTPRPYVTGETVETLEVPPAARVATLPRTRRCPMQAFAGVLVVVLLGSGCATTARYQVPATIREADRRECEERAQKEAEAAEIQSFGGYVGAHPVMLLDPTFYALLPFLVPLDIAGMRQHRHKIFDSELQACVEVKDVEMSHGSEDPLVATKLVELAHRYAQGKYRWKLEKNGPLTAFRSGYGTGPLTAEAELLYKRALAIQEKALGPEHPDIITTLVDYAHLLRETNRQAEAAELDARVKAIRTKPLRRARSSEQTVERA